MARPPAAAQCKARSGGDGRALRLWDRLSLEPYGGPKALAAVLVVPDNADVVSGGRTFLRELAAIYEVRGLSRRAGRGGVWRLTPRRPSDHLTAQLCKLGKHTLLDVPPPPAPAQRAGATGASAAADAARGSVRQGLFTYPPLPGGAAPATPSFVALSHTAQPLGAFPPGTMCTPPVPRVTRCELRRLSVCPAAPPAVHTVNALRALERALADLGPLQGSPGVVRHPRGTHERAGLRQSAGRLLDEHLKANPAGTVPILLAPAALPRPWER